VVGLYSYRRATNGSTRDARRAGTHAAAMTMTTSVNAKTAYTVGLVGLKRYKYAAATREVHNEPGMPSPIPIIVSMTLSPIT
jgi:hypothetical protein